MIQTTSIKHYKKLKKKGISCKLVTKQEINSKISKDELKFMLKHWA